MPLDSLLKMDGYNAAILGRGVRFNTEFIIYDYEEVISISMEMGMTAEEAHEFWEYNQVGAWVGEGTPAFLIRTKD
jgi:hypothetical protein